MSFLETKSFRLSLRVSLKLEMDLESVVGNCN